CCSHSSITTLSLPISFSFTVTATPPIYTLSLHDALPIYGPDPAARHRPHAGVRIRGAARVREGHRERERSLLPGAWELARGQGRSEEHTSELQSRSDLVCRLLLEKKKKKKTNERSQYAKK